MKRPVPWNDQVDVILSDESSSSDSEADGSDNKQANKDVAIDEPAEQDSSEGVVIRRAEMYQDYMKQVPIPTQRGSVIPFTSWIGLSKSIKQLYGQPLHYLTNILVKQWDQMRIGSENEDIPLDTLIHPCKAEATIWLLEEIHRLTTSHHHLAKLWLSDPRPHAFIDPIFPKL
ncbi:hypothetical protein RHSIM_Rhsim04G0199500 [Rhododendron simsii]|uniref:Protein RDM1 n=1 Tax=Rhododendron simsii TaxID=118357 RepID=A0A834LMJ1_RHOSS|nr:hypothetical protein RHSIM_Rhsim04G0199500 [Rhododendron simsii]